MIIIERGRDNKCSNVENLHLNVKFIEHSNECLTFVHALQQRCLDNGGSTVLPLRELSLTHRQREVCQISLGPTSSRATATRTHND